MADDNETGSGREIAGDPLFKPLGRKKAYEEVAEEIRRLIHGQKLQPLFRLPTERDLSDQFGVSRMVVREAIRSLERAGLLLVKKGPRGGIFVAQDYNRPLNDTISNLLAGGNAGLTDLFEIRALIEPYAAARAALLGSEEEYAELAALVSQAELDRHKGQSPRAFNIEFHRRILRMSKNPVLSALGEAVLVIMLDRIRNLASLNTSFTALDWHKKILDALRQRQPEQAKLLMEKDIQGTGDMLARLSPETLLQLAADDSSAPS